MAEGSMKFAIAKERHHFFFFTFFQPRFVLSFTFVHPEHRSDVRNVI